MLALSQFFWSQNCTWNTSNTGQPSATLYAHRYLGQEEKLHQLYLTCANHMPMAIPKKKYIQGESYKKNMKRTHKGVCSNFEL